jgi:hypothetical protein
MSEKLTNRASEQDLLMQSGNAKTGYGELQYFSGIPSHAL